MSDITEIIENTIDDLLSNFFYYDRKGDEDLPVGRIQEAVKNAEIKKDEIIEKLSHIINQNLKNDA